MATARLADGPSCPTSGCPTMRPEIPAADLRRPGRGRCASARRPAATTAWSSTPIVSTAPTSSFLTGFDPRFEEAVLILGPAGDPAILVGNECYGHGRRRAAADAPRSASRTSACRASRATGRGRSPTILADEGIGPGARVGVIGWKTVRRAARRSRSRRSSSTSCARLVGADGTVENAERPADRRGRRAAGHQRGRPAGRLRVRVVPDLARGPRAARRAASRA